MNNAQFKIGQKVVCIQSHTDCRSYLKGNIYTVKSMNRCAGCGRWQVNIGLVVPKGFCGTSCTRCGDTHVTKIFFAPAKNFAPIQTTYASATSEILKKFKQTEERPDKVLTPEKITQ